jgi:hypothetical protein
MKAQKAASDPDFKRQIVKRIRLMGNSDLVRLACGHAALCVDPIVGDVCYCVVCQCESIDRSRGRFQQSPGAKVSNNVLE